MQNIKVISGKPTAQLTALAEMQCITIQSLEKSKSRVCTKIHVCKYTHMADIYIYTHICMSLCMSIIHLQY